MGHTNSTPNIGLPQFIGTDKPTWLGDVNGAMSTIDTKIGSIDAAIATTDAKADNAVADASGAVTTATNAVNTAGNASTTATQANNLATQALTVANNTADLCTNQIVPDVQANKTAIGTLADLTTTAKDNLVNAINEVAQGGGGGGITRTELWSNTDPTTAFSNPSISVSDMSAGYDEIIFQSLEKTDRATLIEVRSTYAIISGATNKFIRLSCVSGSSFDNTCGRQYTVVDATTINVGSGYLNNSVDNTVMVPYKIIGVKY
jgi:hypothetical protein